MRPSLLDLCHGTGRSSHAAAPAIVLGAYLSTHRARRVACHKPVSSSLRCCDSNASNAHLCLRTACSTRASRPQERAGGSESPFPRPITTVGWAMSAVRLAAAATLEAVAAHMRRTVRAGPEDGPARLCIRPYSPQRGAWSNYGNPQRGGPLRRPCSHKLHMLQWWGKEEWRGTFDGVWPMRVGTYLVVRICVRDRSGARGGGVDRYRRRRRRAS